MAYKFVNAKVFSDSWHCLANVDEYIPSPSLHRSYLAPDLYEYLRVIFRIDPCTQSAWSSDE